MSSINLLAAITSAAVAVTTIGVLFLPENSQLDLTIRRSTFSNTDVVPTTDHGPLVPDQHPIPAAACRRRSEVAAIGCAFEDFDLHNEKAAHEISLEILDGSYQDRDHR